MKRTPLPVALDQVSLAHVFDGGVQRLAGASFGIPSMSQVAQPAIGNGTLPTPQMNG